MARADATRAARRGRPGFQFASAPTPAVRTTPVAIGARESSHVRDRSAFHASPAQRRRWPRGGGPPRGQARRIRWTCRRGWLRTGTCPSTAIPSVSPSWAPRSSSSRSVSVACKKDSPASAAQAPAVVDAGASTEVTLYTTREPALIQPLLDAFTADTGIRVNTVFVRDGLPERLRAEGTRSPADVLMTVDTGNLLDLVQAGSHPAHPVPGPHRGHPLPAPRSRGTLVRALAARPGALRAQGPGARGVRLRGPRRSPLEGEGVHPLRSTPLQHQPVRRDDRPRRGAGHRGLAEGREGQPRASGGRRGPGGRSRHPRRHLRSGDRQRLLRGPDEERRARLGAAALGRCDQGRPPHLPLGEGWRHACQHQRRGGRQARAPSRRGGEAPRVPRQ